MNSVYQGGCKIFPFEFDFYGKGGIPINDKKEALWNNKFKNAIENSNINNCWPDKIIDNYFVYTYQSILKILLSNLQRIHIFG